MCKYCEENVPTGGGIENGDEDNACTLQISESLRDEIRSFVYGMCSCSMEKDELDMCMNEFNRLINEIVNRSALYR